MGTANHYFLDAVAGAAVMGVGLLLTPVRDADGRPGAGAVRRLRAAPGQDGRDTVRRGFPDCQCRMPDFRG